MRLNVGWHTIGGNITLLHIVVLVVTVLCNICNIPTL